ncbi:MAG: YdiY family protein [Gammaproteobacteria bacterium]
MNRYFATRVNWIGVATAAALCCNVAAAEEKKEGWSGAAGLGYLSASGNADNTNINASGELYYDWEQWHHSAKALAIGAQADGDSSAERYTLELKTQRDFTDTDYIYGLIAAQNDRFAGVRQQVSETIGYGRRLINTDVHVLNVEAGIGFRQLEFADTIDPDDVTITPNILPGSTVGGEKESSAIVRLGGNYRWNFSETAHFDQSLAIEAGSDNTSTESISAVTAKLLGAMDLVFSFTVKNNSDVPIGTTSTDRFTAISLNYSW